jgi:hypothetical protein
MRDEVDDESTEVTGASCFDCVGGVDRGSWGSRDPWNPTDFGWWNDLPGGGGGDDPAPTACADTVNPKCTCFCKESNEHYDAKKCQTETADCIEVFCKNKSRRECQLSKDYQTCFKCTAAVYCSTCKFGGDGRQCIPDCDAPPIFPIKAFLDINSTSGGSFR